MSAIHNQPSFWQSTKEAGRQIVSTAAGTVSGIFAGACAALFGAVVITAIYRGNTLIARKVSYPLVQRASNIVIPNALTIFTVAGTVIVIFYVGIKVRNAVYQRL